MSRPISPQGHGLPSVPGFSTPLSQDPRMYASFSTDVSASTGPYFQQGPTDPDNHSAHPIVQNVHAYQAADEPAMDETTRDPRQSFREQAEPEPQATATPDLYKTHKETLHMLYGYPLLLLDVCLPNQLMSLLEVETKHSVHPSANQFRSQPWTPSTMDTMRQLPDEDDESATLRFIADRTERSEDELKHSLSRAQFLIEARRAVDVQISRPTPLVSPTTGNLALDGLTDPAFIAVDSALPSPSASSSMVDLPGQETTQLQGTNRTRRMSWNVGDGSEIRRPRSAPVGEDESKSSSPGVVESLGFHDTTPNGRPRLLRRSSTEPSMDQFAHRMSSTELSNVATMTGLTSRHVAAGEDSPHISRPVITASMHETGPFASPSDMPPQVSHAAPPGFPHAPRQGQGGQLYYRRRPAEGLNSSWDDVLFLSEFSRNPSLGNQDVDRHGTVSRITEDHFAYRPGIAMLRPGEVPSDAFFDQRLNVSRIQAPPPSDRRRQVFGDGSNRYLVDDKTGDFYRDMHGGGILHSTVPFPPDVPTRSESHPDFSVRVPRDQRNIEFSDSNSLQPNQRPQRRVPRSQAELAEEEDCESVTHQRVRTWSPPASPPISPSTPPVEAPTVLQLLSDLSQTGPFPRARTSHRRYHALHRSRSFPNASPVVPSRIVTEVEEVMQEAELLCQEIRRSGREPSKRERALLLAREERRTHLKEREKHLLKARREFIRQAENVNRAWVAAGYLDPSQVPGQFGVYPNVGYPHGMPVTLMPLVPNSIPIIPPHGQHLPNAGRAILGGYSPGMYAPPGAVPGLSGNSPVLPQYMSAVNEVDFRQGGVRLLSSSTGIALDLTSPMAPYSSLPLTSHQENWPLLPVPISKDFVLTSAVSEEPWSYTVPL